MLNKFKLNNDFFNQSNIELNLENVTNDEYLKIYKIDGVQIDDNINTLHSYLSLDTEKNDIEFYTSLEVYEDLSKDKDFFLKNFKNIYLIKGFKHLFTIQFQFIIRRHIVISNI